MIVLHPPQSVNKGQGTNFGRYLPFGILVGKVSINNIHIDCLDCGEGIYFLLNRTNNLQCMVSESSLDQWCMESSHLPCAHQYSASFLTIVTNISSSSLGNQHHVLSDENCKVITSKKELLNWHCLWDNCGMN